MTGNILVGMALHQHATRVPVEEAIDRLIKLLDDLDAANEGLEPEEDCCDMADYDMTDRPPRLSYCWRPAIPWMASRNRKDDEQGRGTHPGL